MCWSMVGSVLYAETIPTRATRSAVRHWQHTTNARSNDQGSCFEQGSATPRSLCLLLPAIISEAQTDIHRQQLKVLDRLLLTKIGCLQNLGAQLESTQQGDKCTYLVVRACDRHTAAVVRFRDDERYVTITALCSLSRSSSLPLSIYVQANESPDW